MYRDTVIDEGGVLVAAFDARHPTRDVDLHYPAQASDVDAVLGCQRDCRHAADRRGRRRMAFHVDDVRTVSQNAPARCDSSRPAWRSSDLAVPRVMPVVTHRPAFYRPVSSSLVDATPLVS